MEEHRRSRQNRRGNDKDGDRRPPAEEQVGEDERRKEPQQSRALNPNPDHQHTSHGELAGNEDYRGGGKMPLPQAICGVEHQVGENIDQQDHRLSEPVGGDRSRYQGSKGNDRERVDEAGHEVVSPGRQQAGVIRRCWCHDFS